MPPQPPNWWQPLLKNMPCFFLCRSPKAVYKPTVAFDGPPSFDTWHTHLHAAGVYDRARRVEVETRRKSILVKTATLKVKHPVKGKIYWKDGTVETIVFVQRR